MLRHLLTERSESIVEGWFRGVIEAYPSDSVGFLRDEKDQFRNPVGHTLRREIGVLYSALSEGLEPEALRTALDNIVRILALQDMRPARAMAFVFLLKGVVRKELQDEPGSKQLDDELREFESRIDGLALEAFDCFMDCRETIYKIRASEADRRSAKLLERINKVYGDKSCQSDRRTESR
ncbi:MAG: RsbRD N-terminal domain-containing protein [Candidatus Zixiibacteriota bacterium]|nr:MAG: RsbRD N-terminal domain-containing protein [candidate division Zixibacteria bacterium]